LDCDDVAAGFAADPLGRHLVAETAG
jgi:hypothetical protein